MIDEFAEAFAGRSIYSVGDLYSGYDQFQLAVESRDITTMRTPLRLVRMCTLPQGGTNSVSGLFANACERRRDHGGLEPKSKRGEETDREPIPITQNRRSDYARLWITQGHGPANRERVYATTQVGTNSEYVLINARK